MTLRAEDTQGQTRPLTIEWEGIDGALNLVYRYRLFTPEMEAEHSRVNREEGWMVAVPRALCKLVVEWDYEDTDEAGKARRIPLKPEALTQRCSSAILLDVWQAIQEDQLVNPTKRIKSAAGSSPEAVAAASRNGTQSTASHGSFTV